MATSSTSRWQKGDMAIAKMNAWSKMIDNEEQKLKEKGLEEKGLAKQNVLGGKKIWGNKSESSRGMREGN